MTKSYNPGGDMTEGVARAHVETPEEIAANPIEDAPVQTCEACFGTGADLDFECPATGDGLHVINTDLSEVEVEALPAPVKTAARPNVPVGETYKRQHAKVLRFEISVGADDDEHTLEQFEVAVRTALQHARDHAASVYVSGEQELRFHNLTTQGGYYILDGKVCTAGDYDPQVKGRKPGTFPPPWAGGPVTKEEKLSYVAEQVNDDDDAATKVAKLAGNMNKAVKAAS